ncbi:hypothetical protein [Marinagarivorans algicola]|uniref:hypothetical protein n=1 Tax=Marinagarivorans algicola TaxID=1513270 RepID=UPI0006B93535|nr:hypothetical protein [Marinagarivorans algicola]
MNKLIICTLLAALLGCQSLSVKPKALIAVEYHNRPVLEFTGRGGAAGMMMSSSMGAMGIAIGVAIDEGIAKDLHASASQGGFVLTDAINEYLGFHNFKLQNAADKKIIIKHIGFKASGDLIVPWIEIDFIDGGHSTVLTYSAVAGDNATAAELATLKEAPKLAAATLRNALFLVLDEVNQ